MTREASPEAKARSIHGEGVDLPKMPPSPAGGFGGGHRLVLSVVVPVMNEEAILPSMAERLHVVMEALGEPYEILFVDDGSTDGTRRLLERLAAEDPHIGLLAFSRNFGHQAAITAGMAHAVGDAVVIIDGDLQDPPEVIPKLVAAWRAGFEVVNAQRTERQGESVFKRASAALFYRLLTRLTDVPITLDAGDFRLVDRKVCNVLVALRERHRFVRGLVAWAGFRQTSVPYVRHARGAGSTKYTLPKMLTLALDAVTSFSDRPLRLTIDAGVVLMLFGLAGLAALGLVGARTGALVPFAAVLAVATGLLLAGMGVLGTYLTRVLDEVRDRPLYVVDEALPPRRDEESGAT